MIVALEYNLRGGIALASPVFRPLLNASIEKTKTHAVTLRIIWHRILLDIWHRDEAFGRSSQILAVSVGSTIFGFTAQTS